MPNQIVRVKYRFFDYARALMFQFSSDYNHLSFSSTIEDAFKGCRFKLIRYQNDWWRTVERTITTAQERGIWYKAHSINGKKYDLIGLLSHATPWEIIRGRPEKYWCSECNAYITKPYIYKGDKTEITPDELYEWLLAHPQEEKE